VSRLLPKEHGAYGQLGVPLAVALGSGRPTLGAVLLAMAAGCAFVAHEPLLVALGRRGSRKLDTEGDRAQRAFGLRAALAAVSGISGIILARPSLSSLAGPVVAAVVVLVLVAQRKERTLVGEAAAAVALSGAAVPVATAAAVPLPAAAWQWATWSVGFVTSTVVVRAVIARSKRRPERMSWGVIAAAVGVVAAGWMTPLQAAAPLVLTAAVVRVWSPHARHLRKLGFALLGASFATGAWLVFAT
jgi:hypothetical protein